MRKNSATKDDLKLEFFPEFEDDDEDGSSDDMAPAKKSQGFEFTNYLSTMRIVRLVLCLQAIGIMIDNPSLYCPLLFRIFCRNILFYSIRFYSRPFIDAVYIVQYYLTEISNLLNQNYAGNAKNGVEVQTRKLANS